MFLNTKNFTDASDNFLPSRTAKDGKMSTISHIYACEHRTLGHTSAVFTMATCIENNPKTLHLFISVNLFFIHLILLNILIIRSKSQHVQKYLSPSSNYSTNINTSAARSLHTLAINDNVTLD